MSRPIQHHYPAALVGEFGAAPKGRHKGANRERIVHVARRGVPKVVQEPAARVGYQRRQAQLYDIRVPGHGESSIDGQWTLVESRIPELVRALRRYDDRSGIS
ncbi:MAG: hypothetical protein M3256_24920 [Actinomycetota bacterium]|nr:hypothetical protein [Actinomycetota bacterium]